jgi:hypothetical protein
MLLPVVANQCQKHRIHGRMASPFAMSGKNDGIPFTRNDRPDDRHASNTGDVGDDMMQLHICVSAFCMCWMCAAA